MSKSIKKSKPLTCANTSFNKENVRCILLDNTTWFWVKDIALILSKEFGIQDIDIHIKETLNHSEILPSMSRRQDILPYPECEETTSMSLLNLAGIHVFIRRYPVTGCSWYTRYTLESHCTRVNRHIQFNNAIYLDSKKKILDRTKDMKESMTRYPICKRKFIKAVIANKDTGVRMDPSSGTCLMTMACVMLCNSDLWKTGAFSAVVSMMDVSLKVPFQYPGEISQYVYGTDTKVKVALWRASDIAEIINFYKSDKY